MLTFDGANVVARGRVHIGLMCPYFLKFPQRFVFQGILPSREESAPLQPLVFTTRGSLITPSTGADCVASALCVRWVDVDRMFEFGADI